MALNFPDSPTLNQVYTDTTSGFSYQWDGTVWQSYSDAATDNISIVDDISSLFDGVTDTFALAVGGSSISPASQQMRVVLGGIVQEPGSDYTTSGSNIIFSTPPTAGLDCSIVSLGRAISLTVAVLNDGSVTTSKIFDGSVTPAKLSTGGPSWNTGGDLSVSGTVSATSFSGDGSGLTGISSVSFATTSFALSGTPNITVGLVTASSAVIGSAVTITSGGITVGVITATSVSVAASVTALEYYGDGSKLQNVGGELDITSSLFI